MKSDEIWSLIHRPPWASLCWRHKLTPGTLSGPGPQTPLFGVSPQELVGPACRFHMPEWLQSDSEMVENHGYMASQYDLLTEEYDALHGSLFQLLTNEAFFSFWSHSLNLKTLTPTPKRVNNGVALQKEQCVSQLSVPAVVSFMSRKQLRPAIWAASMTDLRWASVK